MKKTLLLASLSLLSYPVFALPDYDPFADATASGGTSYAVGGNLIGQTDAGGQSWVQAGPTSATQPKIVTGNLTYAGLPASQGNSVSFGGNGESARLGLSTAVTSGSVYYSFLMNVSSLGSLPTSGVFWLGFNNTIGSSTSSPSSVGTRLYARSVTGQSTVFQLGVQQNGGTTIWDSTDNFSLNTTLFIVGGYTLGPGTGDDVAQLWINPDSSSFGAATPPATSLSTTGTDLPTSQVASFVLCDRITSEPTGVLDELRLGTSWADVTTVPEPGVGSLMLLGLLGLAPLRRARRS